MKILFLLGATSRIRNFRDTLVLLADRGHDIRLAGRLRKGTFELPAVVAHERISGRVNPTQRADEWREFVDLLRGARDYARYFAPRYAQATRLVRRAYEIAPTEFALFCERHAWVKRHPALLGRALAFCEELIPVDAAFEAFLREERPDLVLVTPLVTFESYQTDYVKAAHKLGIPVVFVPFSWDNLTNKGLMRILPDRVLVWNDIQRREAIELHGCPPDTVVVTGAARFDDFFSRTPSTGRAEFLESFGLNARTPMVLYLGSSQLTGPNEMELVRRWAESIRRAEDSRLRTCGILVRPHPAVRSSWTSVDFSDLGNVALSLDASRGGDQELFDSIHHAHAAVGLNTSAMLEAAIVGRPVHTLVIPGFDEGQIGTMHFHYLVEAYGGLASVARDFPEHHRQIAPLLQQAPSCSDRSRTFAEQFLRPHGVGQPVAPLLAAEIERAAADIRKSPQAATPAYAPLRRGLYLWLRRRGGSQKPAVDSTVIGTSLSLRPVRTALEEVQQGTSMVFVGPWVDAIGLELLYWIPFVRWVAAAYALPPERLVVLSHGGQRDWYGSIAHRFLDTATLFSDSERAQWTRRTVPQSEQDPKQAVMSPFDADIVERAARAFDLSEPQVLHPFLLFRTFRRLHADGEPDRFADILKYEPLSAAPGASAARSGVAVSGECTPALPDTEAHRQFLAELAGHAAAAGDVVALDGLPLADRVHALERVSAFVGAYGDMAILAAFCGTPAITYHSERLPAGQIERLEAAAATAGWGTVTTERAKRFKRLRLPVKVRAS